MSFEIPAIYLLSGQPHILLCPNQSSAWTRLNEAYGQVREEIQTLNPDMILYMSTQWLSVLGWLFQADPEPEWVHVDGNWHELGSMPYKFKVDDAFAPIHAEEVSKTGRHTMLVNYEGFPIDTGTVVVQKLINPENRFAASMISCNMYAEKKETMAVGAATLRAIKRSGKKVVVVLVSNLSNRYFIHDIDPLEDKISSKKDHEWNLKILELLGEGRLEDVAQCAREFAREANADMHFKGIWWLNALGLESNNFSGRVFDYQPVWGTGSALVGLYPTDVMTKNWNSLPDDKLKSKKLSGVIDSETAALPVGPYPHAREEGDFVFLSGIGPRERDSNRIPGLNLDAQGKVVSYDIVAETHGVFRNVKAVLEASGCTLSDVIDVQVFLTNMKLDFKLFNEVYGQYFPSNGPTRTTVGIEALPTPIHVEFKVVAKKNVGR